MRPLIWMLSLWTSFIMSGAVRAASTCDVSHPTATQSGTIYFVSGILRKNSDPATIKLVHVVEVASSPSEALGSMLSKIALNYPDFGVLDTLVSEESSPLRGHRCGSLIEI